MCVACEWLPHKDSNLNKQIQNLRCYHYTMRQLAQKRGELYHNADCPASVKINSPIFW